MSSSIPPASGAAPPPGGKGRRRPAATIDLTATEVDSSPASEPAAEPVSAPAVKSSPQAAPAHAAQAAPPEQTEAGTQMRGNEEPMRPNAETPHREEWSQRWRTALSGLRSMSWPPPNVPWPLIGAAAASGFVVFLGLMIAGFWSGRDTGVSPLDARLLRVEQTLRELAARPAPSVIDPKTIEDLTGRIARLEAAIATPRPQAADPALANRISTIEGQLKALGETVSILGRRSDEIAAIAREARQRADATAAALAELAQKVTRSGASVVERSEFDALVGRLAAIERSEKAVEAELAKRPAGGSADRSVRLAVAAVALRGAVERGDPFAAELMTVKSLAGAPKAIAALEPFAPAGVPAAAALARELAALAPALYQAAGAGPRDGSFLHKLQASAEKLVRIRPLDEVQGTDPATIIARIEVKAGHADLAGALGELAKLPAAARAPAQAWINRAEARQAAVESSRQLAADALAALGK